MGKFTITHEVNVGVDGFWRTYFDKTITESIYQDDLGYPEFRIIDQTVTDQTITRKINAVPKLDWPGPVQKLFGAGFRFVIQDSFDKANPILVRRYAPNTLADKLRIEATLRVEPIGGDRVRTIQDRVVEAKIFGVGGLVEASLEKQFREEADRIAVALNRRLS